MVRGDKSTNELQDGLKSAGRAYKEISIYTTSSRSDLESNIERAIAVRRPPNEETEGNGLLGENKGDAEMWIAFFSPSSAEYVLPILGSRLGGCKIAAIGGTTERYLLDRGLEVQATAEQPTAEGLVRAIQAHRQTGT